MVPNCSLEKILNSGIHPHQHTIIPIASKIESFLNRDNCNSIHFWYCPSKLKWPRQTIVDKEVKADYHPPIQPSKNSFLFSKKKECNDLLKSWKVLFFSSFHFSTILLLYSFLSSSTFFRNGFLLYLENGFLFHHFQFSSICFQYSLLYFLFLHP